MVTRQPDGVWGGLDPSEVRRLWRRPRSSHARGILSTDNETTSGPLEAVAGGHRHGQAASVGPGTPAAAGVDGGGRGILAGAGEVGYDDRGHDLAWATGRATRLTQPQRRRRVDAVGEGRP